MFGSEAVQMSIATRASLVCFQQKGYSAILYDSQTSYRTSINVIVTKSKFFIALIVTRTPRQSPVKQEQNLKLSRTKWTHLHHRSSLTRREGQDNALSLSSKRWWAGISKQSAVPLSERILSCTNLTKEDACLFPR